MRGRTRDVVEQVAAESLDAAFEVDRLAEDNLLLRAALSRIASLRRDQFRTSFDYEMAVRKQAAQALGREP